jgi:hypothetical protein
VYDAFDEDIKSADELLSKELLFGSVVCGKVSTRGKNKCIQVDSFESTITKEDLPHLNYSSNAINPLQGNWFYMKEGQYFVLNGISLEYHQVKHLEGIAIYGDEILRLRLVIELLKRKVDEGILALTVEDYKDIAYRVLKADPTFARTKNDMLRDGISNWVQSMLLTPLYRNIPKAIRGKAIL